MGKIILRICFLIIMIHLVSGCVFFEMTDFSKNTTIKTPDLTLIPDGVYVGSCASGIVSATIEVEVTDHSIVAFRLLKHKHGPGHSAESLAQTVIDAQTLEVDTVSGATISSKVVLKAAENALSSAITD